MNFLKSFGLFLLSLLLIITLTLAQSSLLLRFKLLKPNFYTTKLADNKIYLYTEKFIKKTINRGINTNNIPNDIIDNVLPKEWVKTQYEDLTINAVDYFKGKQTSISPIDINPLLTNFDENYNKVLQNSKITPNSDQKKEIDKLKILLSDSVADLPLSSKNNSDLNLRLSFPRKIVSLLHSTTFILMGFALCLTFLMLFIAPKKSWTGYSFVISGTLFLIPPVLTLFILKPSNATMMLDVNNVLSTQPISDITNFKLFAVSIVSELLSYMAVFGGIIILIGIILLSLSAYFNNKKSDVYAYQVPFGNKSSEDELKDKKNRNKVNKENIKFKT